jgi:prepilin-type N-terminal cleavage/methylation domain-containing protein/prepilin-type processing-associated H-X9-DG protein
MKKKGFTLVELLVVIAIIALLMGILMPALARVRQIAYRLYCGTNLSGIGKAMLIYCNDYEDQFPRAGMAGANPPYNASVNFNPASGRAQDAYTNGSANITSCFYLLIKFSEVTPKSFLCKGDAGIQEFNPSDHGVTNRDIVDLFDFGQGGGQEHCSYAYHNPFPDPGASSTGYSLTSSSDPGMAVAADPTPWMKAWETGAKPWSDYVYNGSKQEIQKGNASTHQDDGQNVLFVDGHTAFEKDSRAGVDMDNIYTCWSAVPPTDVGRQQGVNPTGATPGTYFPKGRNDSVLVTDAGGAPPKGRTCFPADTVVWVDGEMTKISEVSAGSMVDKPTVTKTVVDVQKTVCSHEIESVDVHDDVDSWERYDITLENGNSVVVADCHYFLLSSGDWISSKKLEAGSKLQTLEGAVAVKSVVKSATPSTGTVYNLKIKGSERYLVGKDGLVVRDW